MNCLDSLLTRPPLNLTGGSWVKKSSFSSIFPVEKEEAEVEVEEEEEDGKIRHWRSARPKRNWESKRAPRRGPAPRKKRISIMCDSMATIIIIISSIVNISTKICLRLLLLLLLLLHHHQLLILQVIHWFIIQWVCSIRLTVMVRLDGLVAEPSSKRFENGAIILILPWRIGFSNHS